MKKNAKLTIVVSAILVACIALSGCGTRNQAKEVQLAVRFELKKPETAAQFAKAADACLKISKTEKGTLQYDWWHNADKTVFSSHERFKDSQAFLDHLKNVAQPDALTKIGELADISIDVCGEITPEVRELLKGLPVTYYDKFVQGM